MRRLAHAQLLGGVVVERQAHARDVGKVGRDVAGPDLDLAVLHVLGVDEEDVFEAVELLQEGSAHESVEVGARDEAVAVGHDPVVGS